MGDGLMVIVPDDAPDREKRVTLWKKHGAGDVVSEIDSRVTSGQSGSDRSGIVLDAAASDHGRGISIFNSREDIASTVGVIDFFDTLTFPQENYGLKPSKSKRESIPPGLRYVFHPVIYTPPMLELRRFIEEKGLGETIGMETELVFSQPHRGEQSSGQPNGPVGSTPDRSVSLEHVLISTVLVFWLRGRPDGMRADTENRMLFWYGNGAVEITLAGETSETVERWVSFSGSLACKGGSVLFDSKASSLVVAPLDEEFYHHPLPEGDSEYYFILDTMESINRGNQSRVLPESIVREALVWYNDVVANQGSGM